MRYIAIVLCLIPLAALAHGPSRQKVTLSIEVAAPPEKVWEYIGDFKNMDWHPRVSGMVADDGLEPDVTTRTVTYAIDGAPTMTEILYKWRPEKHSYSTRVETASVDALPVTNFSSHLTVKPSEGGSRVEWKGAFYRGYPNNEPPEHLNDEAAVAAVTAYFQEGLDAIASHFASQ